MRAGSTSRRSIPTPAEQPNQPASCRTRPDWVRALLSAGGASAGRCSGGNVQGVAEGGVEVGWRIEELRLDGDALAPPDDDTAGDVDRHLPEEGDVGRLLCLQPVVTLSRRQRRWHQVVAELACLRAREGSGLPPVRLPIRI